MKDENKRLATQCAAIELCIGKLMDYLNCSRRDAYAYAYRRVGAPTPICVNNNKNINSTTDENRIKQVNRIDSDRGSLRESIDPRVEVAEVVSAAESLMGIPGWYAAWWHRYMAAAGWRTNRGESVSRDNWRPLLMTWWRNCRDEERERIRREAEGAGTGADGAAPGKTRAHDWRLCAERCANCREGGGCVRGIAVPPAWQPRPIPPEECPRFAAV